MELTLLRIRIKDVHNAYNHYRRFCGIISSPFIFAFAFCYCGDEIPLAEMSAAFCSFDCQVDGLRDALALPVTWPRGRKVLSVGNPTKTKSLARIAYPTGSYIKFFKAVMWVRNIFGEKE